MQKLFRKKIDCVQPYSGLLLGQGFCIPQTALAIGMASNIAIMVLLVVVGIRYNGEIFPQRLRFIEIRSFERLSPR